MERLGRNLAPLIHLLSVMGADQVLRFARFSLRVPGGAWSDAEVLGHHVFVSDVFMPASSLGLHFCVSLPVPPIHLELYLKCTHLLCTTYTSAGECLSCSLRGSRNEALSSPLSLFMIPTFYLYWPSALLHPQLLNLITTTVPIPPQGLLALCLYMLLSQQAKS